MSDGLLIAVLDLVPKCDSQFQVFPNGVRGSTPIVVEAFPQIPCLWLPVYALESTVGKAIAIVDAVLLELRMEQIEPREMHMDEEGFQSARSADLVVKVHSEQSFLLGSLEQ